MDDLPTTPEGFEQLLKSLFGPDIYAGLISGTEDRAVTKLSQQIYKDAKLHPLGIAMQEALSGVATLSRKGQLTLPHKVFWLFELVGQLRAIQDLTVRRHFAEKLAVKRLYASARFELATFTEYLSQGYDVRLFPESRAKGVKTPDFYLHHRGKIVLLECKSLDDDTAAGSAAWSVMELRISKVLREFSDGYEVSIEGNEELSQADALAVAKVVGNALKAGPGEYSAPKVRIRIVRLTSFGVYSPIPQRVPPREGWRAFVEMEIHGDLNVVRRIMAVTGRPFVQQNKTDRILANLSKAASQFFDGYPCVVHIQLPYEGGPHFQEVADRAYSSVYHRVQEDSRINAVVITGRFIDDNEPDTMSPVIINHTVVPNMRAPIPLPSGFELLGAEDGSAFMHGEKLTKNSKGVLAPEGTAIVAMQISSPLREQCGRWLLKFCAPDGRHQVIVWQNFKRQLAFDLVHAEYGYRRYRADFNAWPVNELKYFGARWSADKLDCMLDRQFVPDGGVYRDDPMSGWGTRTERRRQVSKARKKRR